MNLSPTVAEKALNAWFVQQMAALAALTGSPTDLLRLCMQTTSDGSYEKYGWLGDVPGVRKWLGAKKFRELADFNYEIRNQPWYDGFMVDRNDLRDDKLGAYEQRVRDLPVKMEQFKRKLISLLISGGTSGKAFDGVAFFSNASGVRTIDNLLGGTGVDTLAHIRADLITVITTMAKFTDSEGDVQNLVPDVVVVPIAAAPDFNTVLGSSGDAASSNPALKNPFSQYGITVIGDARLDAGDANDWYAFCTKGILKPFILQIREDTRPVLDDTFVKSTRKLYYSAEMDGDAGYGLPQLAIKVVNS